MAVGAERMATDVGARLERVAVVGAAGKMGSGIAALLAQAMAHLKRDPHYRDRAFCLTLIDTRPEALPDLRGYIETQTARHARSMADGEVVRTLVADTLSIIHTTTDCRQAGEARLVFEAVPETEALKVETLRRLKETCSADAVFLSNTSSIPIEVLDREAGLEGRIIGFHFYNPPVVQELVEVIAARTTRPELAGLARELGRRLGKRLVASRDVAGFIGNGHFVRDALHAVGEAGRLRDRFAEAEAIYLMDRVSREGLVRPMGIFHLMDYVGLDVFAAILSVMARHIPGETFGADLIERMVARRMLGGQRADGSQKDGFFRYEGRRPVAVYAPDRASYVPLGALDITDRALGPPVAIEWQGVRGNPDRVRLLGDHFARVAAADSLGDRLALAYLRASRRIGEKLVSEGVAASAEDVNTVLTSGFQHLYGPFNAYV